MCLQLLLYSRWLVYCHTHCDLPLDYRLVFLDHVHFLDLILDLGLFKISLGFFVSLSLAPARHYPTEILLRNCAYISLLKEIFVL